MLIDKAIVVAGDVCIDWLSIPLDPVSIFQGKATPDNWQLRGGRRMYARRGGAWLTAKFTSAAVTANWRVYGPKQLDQQEIDSLSPDKVIHSLLTLDRCHRESAGKDFVLGVTSFEGFAGPASTAALRSIPLQAETPDTAAVVVLDDAGNGFRCWAPGSRPPGQGEWPRAIDAEKKPLVIYKLRRPLEGGALGKLLRVRHNSRTIALLSAEELRADSDGAISRSLSWERTATDIVVALHRTLRLRHLLEFAHLVIPMGLEGVLHVRGRGDGQGLAELWYCPDKIEGDLSSEARGTMTGFGSAMAAALAVGLAEEAGSATLSGEAIGASIRIGMKAGWRLFNLGFGASKRDDPLPPPEYPGHEIFDRTDLRDFRIYSVPLNPYPKRMCPNALPDVPTEKRDSTISARFERDMADFRAWRILDSARTKPYAYLGEQVVRRGFGNVLPEVPVARFGGLELIERHEMESYRTLRNLIREFLKAKKPERPLCLAVFGAPGAGKSFGVVQVAKALARGNPDAGEIEKFEFNVSQWQASADLAHALHHVRDSALRGNVPLVFFDEFDCAAQGGELAWLKYFLAPMQDGQFNDGAFTHVIGRAIFVFAGGTSPSYAAFQKRALSGIQSMVAAKAPDFLSRLRGYVDVQSIGEPVGVQILRRALLVRSFLARKGKHFLDPKTGKARVNTSVLRAFLHVSGFRHGVRSIEAILDMSRLGDYSEFSASLLAPAEQLELHVPSADFQSLVHSSLELGEHLEQLSQRAHAAFVDSLKGKRDPDHPSMQPWDSLPRLYQNSNLERAAHIPVMLSAVGCVCRKREDGCTPHAFTDDEVELMAELEHRRWMEERRLTQPDHPNIVHWSQLNREDQDKDRDYVRRLPELLREVDLEVYQLV